MCGGGGKSQLGWGKLWSKEGDGGGGGEELVDFSVAGCGKTWMQHFHDSIDLFQMSQYLTVHVLFYSFPGLFPVIFNLAKDARIFVNATCGENTNETYCRLVEHVPNHMEERYAQCRMCYSQSPDEAERHPIENAIDGTGSWWQSPSLANGLEYHYVTITLDLKQVRQSLGVTF